MISNHHDNQRYANPDGSVLGVPPGRTVVVVVNEIMPGSEKEGHEDG
jgi:hypothetical protein